MMMHAFRTAFYALLVVGFQPVSAQLGNTVVNSTIINHQFEQGIFWNPVVLPGWGFAFDVQKDLMFGAIYGYSSNGNPSFLTVLANKTGSTPVTFTGDVYETTQNGGSTRRVGSFTYTPFGVGGQNGAEISISSTILNENKLLLQRFSYAEADPLDIFAAGFWYMIRHPLTSTFSDYYQITNIRSTAQSGLEGVGVISIEDDRIGALTYSDTEFVFAMLVEFTSTSNVFYAFLGNNGNMFGRYWILDSGASPVGSGSHFRAVAASDQEPSTKASMLSSHKEMTRLVETDQYDLAKEKLGDLEPMWPQETITTLFNRSAVALEHIKADQQR